jgi:hypothetical protein
LHTEGSRVKLAGMAKPIATLVSRITPKRRWVQYSLGSMFFVVTAVCVCLAMKVNEEKRRREAIASALDEITEFAFTEQPLFAVVDYLIDTIAPDSWEQMGGRGRIWFFRPTKCLIVSQTEGVHNELGDVLGLGMRVGAEFRWIRFGGSPNGIQFPGF